MTLPGADSASPKPPSYAGRKVWGVYVAGATFHVWTHAEVEELAKFGVEGVMPIVVPPQDREWWLEGEYGYPVLEQLVREAKSWGVPKGAPLCLDVEEFQSAKIVNANEVCHAWAIASRGHGFRTWTYGAKEFLQNDRYGFRWLAEWPEVTPEFPMIPAGFNAWQYATDTAHGIDLDVFQAGRDYMTPDRRVVVLHEPSSKSHISEPVASSSGDQPGSAERTPSPGTAAPATVAGGERADTLSSPPADSLHQRLGAAIDHLNELYLELVHRQ